jgi:hypothetical protein
MGLPNDEPVLLEADQRRPDRAARHAEGRADVGLDEAGIRREVAADDRRAERVVARAVCTLMPQSCRNVSKIVNNSAHAVIVAGVLKHRAIAKACRFVGPRALVSRRPDSARTEAGTRATTLCPKKGEKKLAYGPQW